MPSLKWILLFAIRVLLWKILLEECQVVEADLISIFYEWIPVVLVCAYFLILFLIVLLPFILIIGCLVQFTLNLWKGHPNRPVIYRALNSKKKHY